MNKFHKPQYWYHLTEMNWGDEVSLYPRKHGLHRQDTEPGIKRICVAPSVPHCLVALGLCLLGNVNVYRTKYKVQARVVNKKEVSDVLDTQEAWLLNKTEFVKVRTIRMSKVFEIWGLSNRKVPNCSQGWVLMKLVKEMYPNGRYKYLKKAEG